MPNFRRILAVALTFAVAATPAQALAEELSSQDIEYLSMLHRTLLADRKYNFAPVIDKVSNGTQVKMGKEVCSQLKSGVTWKGLATSLYTQTYPDATPEEADKIREYVMTAWVTGAHIYCPKYFYQLQSQ